MQSTAEPMSVAHAPSYYNMSALSYTELWSSLHSAYHPIPSNSLGSSAQGEQLHELSSAGASVPATNGAMDVELPRSQWSGETDLSGESSDAGKQGTPAAMGPPDREQPAAAVTSGGAAASKDLAGLRTFQPSSQNRLMMQASTFDRDWYSFDARWMDPKFLQGGERFKVADSDAADTLLSMKRAAVVHLNTAMAKSAASLQLRGRDGQAATLKGLYYNDFGEEKPAIEQTLPKASPLRRSGDIPGSDGRDMDTKDSLHPWYWRHQEISRILSSAEIYDSPPAAKEPASEPEDYRSTGHHVLEGYQSAGYANPKAALPYYRAGGPGISDGDFTPNNRYHPRSSGSNLPGDFASARWNVNGPSPQQPYAVGGGTGIAPVITRDSNAGGSVADRSKGGILAHAQQQRKSNDNNNNSNNNNNNQTSQNHQCHICGKSCTRPSSLKTHIRCHYGEKPYLCQLCGKSFSQAANLTAHMRIHSGEKPFKCIVCNRSFSQSSSVKTHMRTHTGERPYPCTFCSKSFSDSSTLSNHRRTHTGEKPYQCRVCYRPFSQSGNLNRHMRIHQRRSGQSAA